MTDNQHKSWYWPPAFDDAQQIIDYYETVEIPEDAMFRFARAYVKRSLEQSGSAGPERRIPPHMVQTVLRAAMMRAIAVYFPRTEQIKVNEHKMEYPGGDNRTIKWIALHYKTDDLGFEALYGEV